MDVTLSDRSLEVEGDRSGQSLAISVRGISKSFGTQQVLDEISLEVAEGTIYGLLGPNGAGKTTLIRILTTLLRPTAGSASILGADVVREGRSVRSRIGLAGQFAAVDAHMTGRENLTMVGRLYNLPKAEARRRADNVLERIHLTDAADQQTGTYSGGMKRRLDLAASMVGRPSVLFLDEPSTGIDPRSRVDIWSLIEELVEEGTTVMLTTQYLDEAERLADRIGVIDGGKLIAEGTANSLKDEMGGDRVEVEVGADDLDEAQRILVQLDEHVTVEPQQGRLTAAAPNGAADLMTVMHKLEAASVVPVNIGLRRPSLNDVFLSLTDHPANDSDPE